MEHLSQSEKFSEIKPPLKGILRISCITDTDPDDKYWCSTKVNEKLQHIGGGGHWAYCSQSCPAESRRSLQSTIIETTSPTTRTSAIITTSATTTSAIITMTTSETVTSQPTSLRILRS